MTATVIWMLTIALVFIAITIILIIWLVGPFGIVRILRVGHDQQKRFLALSFDKLPGLMSDTIWRQELYPLSRPKRIVDAVVDAQRTVEALARTLAPQLVMAERRISPEYLFLIEARRPRDHLAAMGRCVASNLRKQLLPVLCREYRGDPKLSWVKSPN